VCTYRSRCDHECVHTGPDVSCRDNRECVDVSVINTTLSGELARVDVIMSVYIQIQRCRCERDNKNYHHICPSKRIDPPHS
jgi:hypothetical protein